MEPSILIYIGLTVITVGLGLMVSDVALPRDMCGVKGIYSRQQIWDKTLIVAVFLLLFAVSACRIAVGNDYWVYRDDFLLIEQNRHVSFEFGFVWLVRFLQSFLNHDQYLPIFAVFSFFTVLFFVRGLEELSERFGYSLFLFMTAGYYFSGLNSVRYYLVLSVAMYSMKFILQEKWGAFSCCILAAACFHKSVLVVLLLYPLAMGIGKILEADEKPEPGIKIGKKRIPAIALISGLALLGAGLLFACKGIIRSVIFAIYPFYENTMFDQGGISLMQIARCAAVLAFSLLYYRQAVLHSKANRFYFGCNILALLVYMCGSFVPEISRIGFYLNITHVFLLPGILLRMENEKQRKLWTVLIGLGFLAYFALFLRSAYRTDIRLLPYRNWIFQ